MTTKRKIGLAIAALLLMAGLVIFLFQDRLAQRAFDQAIAENVGVDRSAALPDGINVYVCGSGSPMPDADRAGPCLAVLAGRHGFVFDAGSGSIRKLGRMGFPMDRLEGAYLTHLHSDHIDGLGELLLQAWIAGSRGTPLPVSGPAGTDQVIAGLAQAYKIDSGYRIAHHGPAVARPGWPQSRHRYGGRECSPWPSPWRPSRLARPRHSPRCRPVLLVCPTGRSPGYPSPPRRSRDWPSRAGQR